MVPFSLDTLKKAGLTLTAIYAAAYLLKLQSIKLVNFSARDFGVWFPLIDGELLRGLELFAQLVPGIVISPVPGAIGRSHGSKTSDHYALDGSVTAVDILLPAGQSQTDAYNKARSLKIFTAIGVYPHWRRPGMHLGTRKDRTPASPAQWAGLKLADGSQSTNFPLSDGLLS